MERKTQEGGIHGGGSWERKGDGKAHGVDVKAMRKLLGRQDGHAKDSPGQGATKPGSMNRRNH